jgi:hypothetical protein
MFNIPRHVLPVQANPFGLDTDAQGAALHPEVTMRLPPALQGYGNHVPVGIDVFTHVSTSAGGGKINGSAFKQVGIFKDQFDILTPASAFIGTRHGLDEIGRLEAHPDFLIQNPDIRYDGTRQFNTGQIHFYYPTVMFIELFLILAVLALVIALLKPWKW